MSIREYYHHGVTPSAAVNGGLINQNPPPHSNFSKQNPFTGLIQRGFLTTKDEHKGSRYRLNFMFNPGIVAISYGVNTATHTPDQQPPEQLTIPLQGDTPVSTSLDLLFDRTYETNIDNTHPGVQLDAKMLEFVSGVVFVEEENGFIGEGGIFRRAVTVHWGSSKWSPKFFGFIESLTITFTHFTRTMVPNRMVANLTLRQWYSDAITAPADSSAPATDDALRTSADAINQGVNIRSLADSINQGITTTGPVGGGGAAFP